ncbi:Uncharacterised protein [Salmonella enterica subsp. enterica serovar Typhimurium str. DT104]|nr:Uncharacterised protein [Salmonella enterica subsp. enterica serovar Typhimurium str. DT104]
MIPQTIPFVTVKIPFQPGAALLLFLVVRRQFIIKKGEQILLRRLATGERRQVSRTHVTPAAKGGGKAQIGDDFS